MNIMTGHFSAPQKGTMPIIATDMPVMYEDEGQEEMGEADIHVLSDEIVRNGIKDHFAGKTRYQVFSDLNVYYNPVDRRAYVSPDTMVVEPDRELGPYLRSYRIGESGPGPILVVEILSQRSFQQGDLTLKPSIYAKLGVREYILVDVTGFYLPERLLMKKRDDDDTWVDIQDRDGGVTSDLGFRLIIEPDGHLRVIDAATGKRYVRPREAAAEAEARQGAEERVRELEAELARLRAHLGNRPDPK
jgi:Uma2 family endonuclease